MMSNTAMERNSEPRRVAYLVTHPIQYQAPFLKLIAAQPDISLTAFFQSDASVKPYYDSSMGTEIHWTLPLLEGYDHQFLPNWCRSERIGVACPFPKGLWRLLRRGGYDALWVHGYLRLPHLSAMLLATVFGIPVLLRDEATLGSRERGTLKKAARFVFFRILRRLVSVFLATGQVGRDYWRAMGLPDDRIITMPIAVDNERIAAEARGASARREEFRADLGLESGRSVILFCGRLTERKGPDLLVNAAALMKDRSLERRPYVLFAGNGPMRAALEMSVEKGGLSNDVRFLGFQGQEALPALYDLADLFVLPSRGEAWGLVLNEAMNAGTAVLAARDVGAVQDLIVPGENGDLFETGSPESLADRIVDLVADENRCRAMGEASRRIITDWSYAQALAGFREGLDLAVRR